MLYASSETNPLIRQAFRSHDCHIGHAGFALILNEHYKEIDEIQADGDELVKCCDILDRRMPSNRVYTFLGNNAKEIARNW
jgi:hypothetical protein